MNGWRRRRRNGTRRQSAIALVYAGLGDRERAFEWLEKAYDERSNRLAYLGREPGWTSLHPDPRFAALLSRIGLPKVAALGR